MQIEKGQVNEEQSECAIEAKEKKRTDEQEFKQIDNG